MSVNVGELRNASSVMERRHGNVSVRLQPTSATLSTQYVDNGDDSSDDDTSDDNDYDGDDRSASLKDVVKKRLEGRGAAIIALSFGITLTAVLLVFAACRFCRGRRGSWKGRRFHVDGDADYLVDGMYL